MKQLILFGFRAKLKQGFTLVEVLIVVLIISIGVSIITLNLGVFSTEKLKMDKVVQTLSYQFQWAQEKAMMKQTMYRFVLGPNGYQFERFQTINEQWQVLNQTGMRPVSLKGLTSKMTSAQGQPLTEVLIYPSGDMTPFQIQIQSQGGLRRQLTGSSVGALQWSQR